MTEERRLEIIEARKQYHREYCREWRAKNPDKVKKANAKFYAKKADEYRQEREAEKGTEDNGNN